jgi:transposase
MPKKSPGRPKKGTEREKRHLYRIAREHPEYPIAKVAETAAFDGCHKTIVRLLAEMELFSIVAVTKPLLDNRKSAIRLAFANRYRDHTVEDWQNWSFSDESTIELDCAEGRIRYIMKRNERYSPKFVLGKKQAGGGKIMVWSYIHKNGVGPLIFIEGGIDAPLYIEILRRYVLDHCLDRIDENGTQHYYMDDGASCHNADQVIEFCDAKGIQRPNWPPSSPDLNPIEHLWGWMKGRLTNLKKKPKTIRELKDILTELWYSITLQQIQDLYASMPERIRHLRDARGWYTKF